MQTLGLSDSTPRTESRLKSLFWPSIQSGSDVDYLGVQGFWLCWVVAVSSFIVGLFSGHEVMGLIVLLFYYLGGVGVRERSRYSAAIVFVAYLADFLLSWQRTLPGPMVARILISALLFSNLRATWIASSWRPGSEEAVLPPRLSETLNDKIADQFPMWLWPKVRMFYYLFSSGLLLLLANGLLVLWLRRLG